MIINPLYIMKEIFGLLENCPEISFHSSFRNSFNLKVKGIIVNISTNRATLPPYGIVVSEKGFVYLKEEIDLEDVDMKINRSMICINNIRIIIGNKNENYSSDIIINNSVISMEIIEELKDKMILSGKENGFNLNNETLLNCIIYKGEDLDRKKQDNIEVFMQKLNELGLFFRDKDFKDIEILKYFLGRGRGLTPSGDDFLVGSIAMFYSYYIYHEMIYIIKNFIIENKRIYTTDISEQFLILATDGKFSRSIITLIEELKGKKKSSDTINNVIKYGETSGTDIMLGIIWANTILMEVIHE